MLTARVRNLFNRNTISAPRERNSTGGLSGVTAMRLSEYERHRDAGTLPPGSTAPAAPASEPAEVRESTGAGCLLAVGDFLGSKIPERFDFQFGTPGLVLTASPAINGMPRP